MRLCITATTSRTVLLATTIPALTSNCKLPAPMIYTVLLPHSHALFIYHIRLTTSAAYSFVRHFWQNALIPWIYYIYLRSSLQDRLRRTLLKIKCCVISIEKEILIILYSLSFILSYFLSNNPNKSTHINFFTSIYFTIHIVFLPLYHLGVYVEIRYL